MRTEPRRKERTIKTTREMELLLESMPVGRLAVTTEDGPYVVAVNYLFLEGNIYFHSGQAGRKMEALRADSRVCFLVDDVGPQVIWEQGCGISQIYKSVVCFGKAEFVEGPTEKMRMLEKLVQKFVPANQPFSPMKRSEHREDGCSKDCRRVDERKSQRALFVAHGSSKSLSRTEIV